MGCRPLHTHAVLGGRHGEKGRLGSAPRLLCPLGYHVHIPPLVDNEAVRSVSAVAHLDSDPDRRVELEAKFERAFLDNVDRAVAANAAKAARGSDVDLP